MSDYFASRSTPICPMRTSTPLHNSSAPAQIVRPRSRRRLESCDAPDPKMRRSRIRLRPGRFILSWPAREAAERRVYEARQREDESPESPPLELRLDENLGKTMAVAPEGLMLQQPGVNRERDAEVSDKIHGARHRLAKHGIE